MSAEATQEQGRKGLSRTKRWLEATTFLEFQWDAYSTPDMCEAILLDQTKKAYDLRGNFLGAKRSQVFLENKDYNTASKLNDQYLEFLANSYSHSAWRETQHTKLDTTEFIWVSTHPFNLGDWSKLTSVDTIRKALEKYPKVLNGGEVDEDLIHRLAPRTWNLVMHKRQEELTLSNRETQDVLAFLQRRESGI